MKENKEEKIKIKIGKIIWYKRKKERTSFGKKKEEKDKG